MGFPYNTLTADEKVALHLRQHSHTLLRPGFWAIIFTSTFIAMWIILPAGILSTVLLVALALVSLRFGAWPFVVWATTQFAFTNERVMVRTGVFVRRQSDIPLSGLNEISSRQSPFDQILRCGTLILGPESDKNWLKHIPRVVKVQALINDLLRRGSPERPTEVLAPTPGP